MAAGEPGRGKMRERPRRQCEEVLGVVGPDVDSSRAFLSIMTDESKQVAGKVDKTRRRPGWRIGDNEKMIYGTTLANLTQGVSPIAIHFDSECTQTWLVVRMPAPAPAEEEQKLPQAPKAPQRCEERLIVRQDPDPRATVLLLRQSLLDNRATGARALSRGHASQIE